MAGSDSHAQVLNGILRVGRWTASKEFKASERKGEAAVDGLCRLGEVAGAGKGAQLTDERYCAEVLSWSPLKRTRCSPSSATAATAGFGITSAIALGVALAVTSVFGVGLGAGVATGTILSSSAASCSVLEDGSASSGFTGAGLLSLPSSPSPPPPLPFSGVLSADSMVPGPALVSLSFKDRTFPAPLICAQIRRKCQRRS